MDFMGLTWSLCIFSVDAFAASSWRAAVINAPAPVRQAITLSRNTGLLEVVFNVLVSEVCVCVSVTLMTVMMRMVSVGTKDEDEDEDVRNLRWLGLAG